MASLRQKIRGTGGQLFKTSDEEIQTLAGQKGLQAPPTSPLGSAGIGAKPDQAKMAGTPGQLRSALRLSAEAPTLQTQQRREQTRSQATASEAQLQERGRRAAQLEGLDSRVQAMAGQIASQAMGSAEFNELEAAASTDPTMARTLAEFQNDPNDYDLLVQLNQKMGRDVNNMLSRDELLGMYSTTVDQTARDTAEAFAQQSANVSDLNIEELGFSDINELADLLQVEPEQLSDMSVNDLINQTQTAVQDEFNTTDELRTKISDPALGPAERAEARRMLKESGAVGVKGVESDLDILADQIENADTVEFAGQEVEVAELLNDEYISGLAANYLSLPDGDPDKEAIRAADPKFAEWLDTNKASLDQVVGTLDESQKQFAAIQHHNQNLGKTATGDLGDEIIDTIMPGILGQFQTSKQELPPGLGILNDKAVPEAKRTSLLGSFKHSHTRGTPEITRAMANFDQGTLDKIGALDQNSDAWGITKHGINVSGNLSKLPPDANPDDVAAALTDGQASNMKELTDVFVDGRLGNRINPGSMSLPTDLGQLTPEQWIQQGRQKFHPGNFKRNIQHGISPANLTQLKTQTRSLKESPLGQTFGLEKLADGVRDVNDIPEAIDHNTANDLVKSGRLYGQGSKALIDNMMRRPENQFDDTAVKDTQTAMTAIHDIDGQISSIVKSQDPVGWAVLQRKKKQAEELFHDISRMEKGEPPRSRRGRDFWQKRFDQTKGTGEYGKVVLRPGISAVKGVSDVAEGGVNTAVDKVYKPIGKKIGI